MPPGCAFFWLFFFAQAKKSDSRKARKLWCSSAKPTPKKMTGAKSPGLTNFVVVSRQDDGQDRQQNGTQLDQLRC
jgi:hypothetical protein